MISIRMAIGYSRRSRGPTRIIAGASRAGLLVAITILTAATAHVRAGIDEQLGALLAKLPHPAVEVGACVIDLRDDRTVFARGADTPITPASAAKVFVMAAALEELGPAFRFETLLLTDGINLYVIGDGDPAFGDERLHRARDESIVSDFDRWADALHARGVQRISGDLVIDESVFDDQWVHPSWEQEDLDNWYAAPVGALNFNDNCIDITLQPTRGGGGLVSVSFQPETALVKIVNRCRSGGAGTPILHHVADSFEYRISGRCNRRWRFGSVSFPDPGKLFADAFRTVLQRRGISIAGRIVRRRVRQADGTFENPLSLVASRETPLEDVLRRIGKDSQNLFAECLLKRVGYERAWRQARGARRPPSRSLRDHAVDSRGGATPRRISPEAVSDRPDGQPRADDLPARGSWSSGGRVVVSMMRRAGIDTRGLHIADGSGLSRDNTCTARQLATLLSWMHRQTGGSLLHDNLSTAGVDGSLRKRLKSIPGRVFAKTGTMRGVRTLAGYVDDENGPRFAFALLFNGYTGSSAPYKAIQDRFCMALAGN